LTVKTTAGPVVLARPKLRGTDQPFTSRLLGKGVSRTNALEALVLSGFVRGLSVRDVEAALAETLGPEAALSKSTVARVCEAIKTELDAWPRRDLGGIELVLANSLRQRCLVHRCRNLLAEVPTHAQAEVKAAFWQIFDDITAEPGDQPVAQARQRARAFADRYDHRYPAAVACLLDTLPELTCFLRFPVAPMSSGRRLIGLVSEAGVGQ
jgi:transposase-like protein